MLRTLYTKRHLPTMIPGIEERKSLPEATQTPVIRKMRPHDVATVTKLLRGYLRQFKVSSHFKEAETDPVTDFFSFFARHSSPYKLVCSFYHVTSETSIQKLMRHALIVAKENDFYTFIALDIMGNKSFFKKLKFTKGPTPYLYIHH
ncbi:hypothetical protein F2Q68_00028493 [Brassica cretica]|uniref:Glycylpeptide N-tetradecanoyltransferase n=1 Tax=Brassica cretica TaxID=69181 RepID=A0A8S9I861_BRACR|nr:hypothetical protein F2Q68_00028493 [Brassica cretica]